MSKTYAIADLHGRHDLLLAALAEVLAHEPGTLVTLGDYIDRGPDSRPIIARLMSLQTRPPTLWKVVCLKGNHEQMMTESMKRPLNRGQWISNGGETTLASYNNDVPQDHLQWIAGLPSIHVDEHRVFVHAGVDPTCPLEAQKDECLLWYRYADGADIGHGERHVVHGHTPRPYGPECLQHRTNLDTYAWRTGRLVIGVFDDGLPGGPADLIEIKERPAP